MPLLNLRALGHRGKKWCRERRKAWRLKHRPATINHFGVRINISDALPNTGRDSLFAAEYEEAERRILKRWLRPDDIVMELGTGIGFMSLFASRIVGPGNVHTYEANAVNEPIITGNFKLNGLFPRFTIAMLSDRNDEAEFFADPDLWTSSTISPSSQAKRLTIKTLSFRETVARIQPTFLLMDIEGGELAISKMLHRSSLRCVSVETHPGILGDQAMAEFLSNMKAAGFTVAWQQNQHYVFTATHS